MVELRWLEKIMPIDSVMSHRHLVMQYRNCVAIDASGAFCLGEWTEWIDVPTVYESTQAKESQDG